MVWSIEVDNEVYERLKEEAEPFVDTPNSVLRRLLNLDSQERPAEPDQPLSADHKTIDNSGHQAQRGKRPQSKRKRVPAGSILPEPEYELPLLHALVDAGGSAPSSVVLETVGKVLDGRLTELDREPLRSGGIRWHNRIQFVRLRLVERGLMTRDSPRGIWAVSEQGRKYVEERV